MAKDVQTALGSAGTDRDDDTASADRSHAPGFKKTFTREEQTEISVKRREMRNRLFAEG